MRTLDNVSISRQPQKALGSSASQANQNTKKHWLPTSEWAGRLVLPKESERKEGGVFFEVRQAPAEHADLKGKKLWLNFEQADWIDRVTTDIKFSEKTQKGKDNGWQHPDRLNGWKQVSPLESLAGGRAKDDMVVSLENVKVSEGKLAITDEPVQIVGSQKALVTFEKKIDSHTWQVRHWNSETNDFSGAKEVIKTTGREDLAPMKDRRLNRKGWYLYGDPNQAGKMEVSAMEPRALFQVNTDQVIRGKDESLHYLKKENWRLEERSKGHVTKTLLRPEKGDNDKPFPGLEQQMGEAFKLGDKGVLLHLFGGAVGAPATLGVYLGHFAFGLVEVVKDEFTGENKFDVEYKQIYAHNRGGIISGSQKWQAYQGDFHRGLVFDRPTSDTIVKVPELHDESLGEKPVEALEERLAEMTARYRTGHGDGSSAVTAAQNCSQDSSQALYATISDWRQAAKDGELSEGLAEFSKGLLSHITPIFGWAPAAWRRTAKNIKPKSKSFNWIPALKAHNTIIPRQNYEGLTAKALDINRDALIVKTDAIGADNPDVIPSEPLQDLNPFN